MQVQTLRRRKKNLSTFAIKCVTPVFSRPLCCQPEERYQHWGAKWGLWRGEGEGEGAWRKPGGRRGVSSHNVLLQDLWQCRIACRVLGPLSCPTPHLPALQPSPSPDLWPDLRTATSVQPPVNWCTSAQSTGTRTLRERANRQREGKTRQKKKTVYFLRPPAPGRERERERERERVW